MPCALAGFVLLGYEKASSLNFLFKESSGPNPDQFRDQIFCKKVGVMLFHDPHHVFRNRILTKILTTHSGQLVVSRTSFSSLVRMSPTSQLKNSQSLSSEAISILDTSSLYISVSSVLESPVSRCKLRDIDPSLRHQHMQLAVNHQLPQIKMLSKRSKCSLQEQNAL
jgi:hypothetical protein